MNATGDGYIGVVESKNKGDDAWQFNGAFETYELACRFVNSMNANKAFAHMEFRANKTELFSTILN